MGSTGNTRTRDRTMAMDRWMPTTATAGQLARLYPEPTSAATVRYWITWWRRAQNIRCPQHAGHPVEAIRVHELAARRRVVKQLVDDLVSNGHGLHKIARMLELGVEVVRDLRGSAETSFSRLENIAEPVKDLEVKGSRGIDGTPPYCHPPAMNRRLMGCQFIGRTPRLALPPLSPDPRAWRSTPPSPPAISTPPPKHSQPPPPGLLPQTPYIPQLTSPSRLYILHPTSPSHPYILNPTSSPPYLILSRPR